MHGLNNEAGCPSKLLACDRVQLGQPQLCVVYSSKRLRRRSRKHLLGGIMMSDVAERIQLVEAATLIRLASPLWFSAQQP